MPQAGAPRDPVFITGATGFIGTRVLAELAAAADRPLRCLARRAVALNPTSSISVVHGDLTQPETYSRALEGVRTVLHLAARTGKAPRAVHFAINCEGTARLISAARESGVERFINVSTIATQYQHRTAYHYADAKWQAEQLVRSSGLRFVNVRPTLVLGRSSAVGAGLQKIASLPVVPLFGGGTARVQPIHVADVAAFLTSAIDDDRLDHRDVDLGGPEIMTMKDLLTRICRLATGREPHFFPLPGAAAARAVAMVEPLLRFLPISAGQLSAFNNDSTAVTTVPGAMPVRFRSVDAMIRDTLAHG